MTRTLGEKLSAYRRNAGYSQEELAERLNVSRQAISKWERGDALPDTENLIALADLYGASIDALLDRAKAVEKEQIPAGVQGSVRNEFRDEEEEADESADEEEDEAVSGEILGKEEGEHRRPLGERMGDMITSLSVFGATVAFLLWGSLAGAWRLAWTVFLLIPVVDSVAECFRKKRISEFSVPLAITFVYLMIGLTRGIWHPTWIMFLGIPVFYVITDCFERK